MKRFKERLFAKRGWNLTLDSSWLGWVGLGWVGLGWVGLYRLVTTHFILDARVSPKLPFCRSQILELNYYNAAIGDLNQTAKKISLITDGKVSHCHQ